MKVLFLTQTWPDYRTRAKFKDREERKSSVQSLPSLELEWLFFENMSTSKQYQQTIIPTAAGKQQGLNSW